MIDYCNSFSATYALSPFGSYPSMPVIKQKPKSEKAWIILSASAILLSLVAMLDGDKLILGKSTTGRLIEGMLLLLMT